MEVKCLFLNETCGLALSLFSGIDIFEIYFTYNQTTHSLIPGGAEGTNSGAGCGSSWGVDQLSALGRYFRCKVVEAVPTRSQALVGFLRLLCLPSSTLRDLVPVLQLEMAPDALDAGHRISLALVTLSPHPGGPGLAAAVLGSPAVQLRPPIFDLHFGVTSLKTQLSHHFFLRFHREQNMVHLLRMPGPAGTSEAFLRLAQSSTAERVNQSPGPNRLFGFFNAVTKLPSLW